MFCHHVIFSVSYALLLQYKYHPFAMKLILLSVFEMETFNCGKQKHSASDGSVEARECYVNPLNTSN